MMTAKRHQQIVVVLGMAFAILVAAGVYREEFAEVAVNATMLCFSCIGIK